MYSPFEVEDPYFSSRSFLKCFLNFSDATEENILAYFGSLCHFADLLSGFTAPLATSLARTRAARGLALMEFGHRPFALRSHSAWQYVLPEERAEVEASNSSTCTTCIISLQPSREREGSRLYNRDQCIVLTVYARTW